MICAKCDDSVTDEDGFISCSQCKHSYHLACANIKKTSLRNWKPEKRNKWVCTNCSTKKDTDEGSSTHSDAETPDLLTMVTTMYNRMSSIETAVQGIPGLEKSLQHISDQFDSFQKKLEDHDNKIKEHTKQLQSHTEKFSATDRNVEVLVARVNELEQTELRCNLNYTVSKRRKMSKF